jgi:hypothetical protein
MEHPLLLLGAQVIRQYARRVTVPMAPSRGPRSTRRLSGAQRLTLIAWGQLAITVCGVVYGIAITRLLVDLGNTMACFDGDQAACTSDPIGFGDQWRSLIAGATLIGMAALGVVVARRHRRGRVRRVTTLGVLGVSIALNALAALALLSL